MTCKGLLCFSIQSSGLNCQMLSGRAWAARELNEMITWQKNEDSKQWSLGKEYLVKLFKPELTLFLLLTVWVWWLTTKTVGGKSFFLRTLSLLVWEASQSGYLAFCQSLFFVSYFSSKKRSLENCFFWGRQGLETRRLSTHNEDNSPQTNPFVSCCKSLFKGSITVLWDCVRILDGCLYLDVVFWEVPLCCCDVFLFFPSYYWCTDLLFGGKGVCHLQNWYSILVFKDELAQNHAQVLMVCDLSVIRNMELVLTPVFLNHHQIRWKIQVVAILSFFYSLLTLLFHFFPSPQSSKFSGLGLT